MARGFDTDPEGGGIVGREQQLARIRAFLAGDAPDPDRLLLVAGEPGAGKTTLLDAAVAAAGGRGLRVLRARGDQSEAELAFAGLHQLLRPVLEEAHDLPGRQRAALWAAFGLDTDEALGATDEAAPGTADEEAAGATDEAAPGAAENPAEPLLIRLAALTLLSDAAARRPLCLVVDDAHWLDDGSLDTLAFVARRLADEPIRVLAAARTGAVPDRLAAPAVRMDVPPLADDPAGLLLDRQPQPPAGELRERILRQAAGSPLALVELARSTAGLGDAPPDGAAGNLPLSARLEQVFAARLTGLPAATRRVLLLVAAAGDADLPAALTAAGALPGGEAAPWGPAEDAGLVRLASGRIGFRHPLMRSAVYQTATFQERRAAHLALADALHGSPDRRAWHLAAATLAPDEDIAGLLAATADRARRRGGYHAAAAALERAAMLTPDPECHARRLVDAASMAMYAGRPRWVEAITAKAVAATDDPHLLAEASLRAGWALAVTTRHAACLDFLLPIAEAAADTAPDQALAALSTAATVVYHAGDETYRRRALRIARTIGERGGTGAPWLWTWIACDPFTDRAERLRLLRETAQAPGLTLPELVTLGAAAWALDETDLAVRVLGGAMDHLRSTTTAGTNATVAQALALSQFESGAWDAAGETAREAYGTAAESGLEMAATSAGFLEAMLYAVRGDTAGARGRLDAVRAGADLSRSRGHDVRIRLVLATAATVDADYAGAYEHLRGLFGEGPDPAPAHYHYAYMGLADLAAAAERTGCTDDAREIVEAAERRLGDGMSPRLRQLTRRARALLSPIGEAERHFTAALDGTAGDQWPFERAQARLDYAEWLRRRRRTAEARRLLAQALTVFERLDARPWISRTRAELRACGVTAPPGERAAGGVGELTAQELQIARLAAEGLTNRAIGERLLLSPRTIGYHLYQVFPKLGVTSRAQLRGALETTGHMT
ncbi:AAA family ATPase [Streptomyces sp. NPDC051940]|uniref:ATP-binding protein n=1 Tax=Streptomyces sp. NPDC051940 TaxID=3155675 RepID=UPI00342C8FA4